MKITLLKIGVCISLFHAFTYAATYVETPTTIEEGFVTFATPNYFGVLEVLLESVHHFSTRPIVVFGVGCDIPWSTQRFPRMIKKRLDNCQGNIFAQKPRIMLESGLKYGVYVEADDIANQGVDKLFEWAHMVKDFPLCPIHPHDPNDQANIMQFLNVKTKSMHYIHAHVIFADSCKKFIAEWYDACVLLGQYARNADETILNVLLWKYGVTDHLLVYDPYFENYEEYTTDEHPPRGFNQDRLYYYLFHGCKDAVMARKVLKALIENASRSNLIYWERGAK